METQTVFIKFFSVLTLTLVLSGCAPGTTENASTDYDPRVVNTHQPLTIESVSASGFTAESVDSETGLIKKEAVQALDVVIGTPVLEAQLRPLSVNGLNLQASDVYARNGQIYVAYSAIDNNGTIVKRGTIEQIKAFSCTNLLTLLTGSFCLQSTSQLDFPNTDLFGIFSDGTYLWATGSTSDESASPNYARLYKIGLDSSYKPTSVLGTAILPSYAGTSVVSLGSTVLVTSGTSTDPSRMGGLNFVNASTMAVSATQQLYDARGVDVYGTNPSTAFVVRGKVDNNNLGAVVEFNANGSGSALRTINTGGNTIPESKSSVLVGNSLILSSMGDGGFKVNCKATGASILTVNAVSVPGIPAAQTVTNSVIAIPGFILAANGEGGMYLYKFTKSNPLNTSYCQGVTASLVGRLSLTSDTDASTFLNASLSANSIHYLPIFNLFGVLTSKLIVVASGNKGVSLINLTSLNLQGNGVDVDDF